MSELDAVARDEFFDSLLGDFLDESGQLLGRLNENLLQLDEWVGALADEHTESCDEDLLNEMFRAAHSLKGLSAMLGLTDINTLTHKVENVFDAARKDELVVRSNVVELMFQAIDRLTAQVEALKDPDAESVAAGEIIDDIGSLLREAGAERNASSQSDAENALSDLTADVAKAEPTDTATDAATDAAPAQAATTPAGVPQSGQAVAELTGQASDTPAADGDETWTVPGDARSPESEVDLFADIGDESEAPSKYLSIFIDEAELSLDDLTERLLADEEEAEGETVEKLLVTAHRIKGSAASVGLNRAAKLAHLMEDALQTLNDTKRPLTPAITDALLAGADGLRRFVEGLKVGESRTEDFNQLAGALIAAQSADGQDEVGPVAAEMKQVAEEQSRAAGDPTTMAGQPATAPPDVAAKDVAPGVPGNATQTAENQPHDNVATADSQPAHANVDTNAPAKLPEQLRGLVSAVSHDQERTLVGRVVFERELALVGLKAQLVFEKLANLGEICYFDPPADKLEELEVLESVCFGLTTDRTADEISRQVSLGGVAAVTVEPLEPSGVGQEASTAKPDDHPPATPRTDQSPAEPKQEAKATGSEAAATSGNPAPAQPLTDTDKPQPRKPTPAKSRAAEAASKPAETIRVDIERLDQLMNLAGQLVINRARFSQIGEGIKLALGNKQSTQVLNNALTLLGRLASESQANNSLTTADLQAELEQLRGSARRIQADLETVRRDVDTLGTIRVAANDLFETIHQLDRVTDGIQQSVMDTRMLPIGPLFARFKRVIRDITRGNGKQVRLIINGEKTELDKRMIDELGDPLIHMVRNAADHGIESPEEREAAGKPREGTVTLDAFHRGNSIVIQVTDDGRGLDANGIVRKAIDKGLITEADAEKMTPHQIYQLIWEPGLSTAKKITEVSGRGMGMDIVKSKIEDLNGTVDLDSELGKGTTLRIKLPLTLAILPSLMVDIDGDVYAMPLEGVEEIVRVGREDLTTVYGQWTARVRGRVVGLIRLNEVFNFNDTPTDADREDSDETTIVIIGENGRKIGMAVDRVIGEEDIVIKSMAENYRNVAGIAGASILGDGRVSLILDLAALMEMASSKETTATVATS